MLISFSASLATANYPFISSQVREVVLSDSPSGLIFYLQDVMPLARGITSVHASKVVQEHTYPTYLDDVHLIRDSAGNFGLFSPAGGANLVYTKNYGWQSFPVDGLVAHEVTSAYLKGTTYICFQHAGLYVYDFELNTFTKKSLIAVDETSIIGVAAATSYLILHSESVVLYSSPINPLDFTPATGAGGSAGILAQRGVIVACLPLNNGFVVYTTQNAIFAGYTSNANFPFVFKEIANSAGIQHRRHVVQQVNADSHIAWTTSGIQNVQQTTADLVFAELSDALAVGAYAVEAGGVINVVQISSPKVAINMVGQRYIIFSIGDETGGQYKFAYVYDIALKAWGHISVPHVAYFEFRKPEFTKAFTYNDLGSKTYEQLGSATYMDLVFPAAQVDARFGQTLALITELGAVYTVLAGNFPNVSSLDTGITSPVALVGRIRINHGVSLCSHQAITTGVANIDFIAYDPSGAAIKVLPGTQSSAPNVKLGTVTGSSIGIRLSGMFAVTSLELVAEQHGNYSPPIAPSSEYSQYQLFVGDLPVVLSSGEYVWTESP